MSLDQASASDAQPVVPQNTDKIDPQTLSQMSIPQFDAYPLPPGRGNHEIMGSQQTQVLNGALLHDKDYVQHQKTDTDSVKTINANVSDKAAIDNYLAEVNRANRLTIADNKWADYLEQKNLKPDQLTGNLKEKYDKLQEIHTQLAPMDANGKTILDQRREELVKACDGKDKITEDQLKDFEKNRLAMGVDGEKALAHHPVAISHHPHHQTAQDTEHPHQGAEHPHQRRTAAREDSDEYAQELDKQELARITGAGTQPQQEAQRTEVQPQQQTQPTEVQQQQVIGQPTPLVPQSTDQWANNLDNWEKQYLGHENTGLSDQQRYQQDYQAWQARYGQQQNARPEYAQTVVNPNNIYAGNYNPGYNNQYGYNPYGYNGGGLFGGGIIPPVYVGFGFGFGPRPWWHRR